MKRPCHEQAAAVGADEDLISLLMNDPLLLCQRPLRPCQMCVCVWVGGDVHTSTFLKSPNHLMCKRPGQKTGAKQQSTLQN